MVETKERDGNRHPWRFMIALIILSDMKCQSFFSELSIFFPNWRSSWSPWTIKAISVSQCVTTKRTINQDTSCVFLNGFNMWKEKKFCVAGVVSIVKWPQSPKATRLLWLKCSSKNVYYYFYNIEWAAVFGLFVRQTCRLLTCEHLASRREPDIDDVKNEKTSSISFSPDQ